MKEFENLFIESLGSNVAGRALSFILPSEGGDIPDDAVVSVRMNSRKILKFGNAPLEGSLPLAAKVPWCDDTFLLKERPNFTADPLFNAGAYYVQDPSCAFLGAVWEGLYGAESGRDMPVRALDLCAAPGGKSTLLSTLLCGGDRESKRESGTLVVSNEVISSRAAVLAENMAKWGAANSVVTNSDPSAFTKLKGYFNFILVDAPCSGEGMFRKNAQAAKDWSLSNVKLCAGRQRRILADVWPSLAEGGILVYSTCTFNHFENDDNLRYIMEELGGSLVALPPTIQKIFTDNGVVPTPAGGFQFVPGLVEGEGQYFAVVRKGEERMRSATGISGEYGWKEEVKGDLLKMIPQFVSKELKVLAKSLKILSSGVAAGTLLESRKGPAALIPHPDLALCLHYAELTEILGKRYKLKIESYELDREEMLRFLSKELLVLADAPTGYLLLTYKGYGTGFVKNLGNRCNSLLPNARRIRNAAFLNCIC